MDDCPECNSFYREDWSFKKARFDQRPRGPIIRERGDDRHISVHDRRGGRVSVHDRLGGRTMITQEEGFLLMSGLNKLLLLKFLMSTHTAEIRKESLFMTTLIGLDGAQEV